MMSQTSKRELLAALRPRYREAGWAEKKQILDELTASTGYHRKYAFQLLNHVPRDGPRKRRAATKRKYRSEVVVALEEVWRTANRICGKRLVPNLKDHLEALERHDEIKLDRQTRELLLELSAATADRLLNRARQGLPRHGLSTTKPGTLLKQSIPVRTFADWDDAKPGFMEIDLVAHCRRSDHGRRQH